MNIVAARRKREAQELIRAGWTATTLLPLDFTKGISKEHQHANWVKREQEVYGWCTENAGLGEFKFVSPNTYLFRDKSIALIFKLTWGGE